MGLRDYLPQNTIFARINRKLIMILVLLGITFIAAQFTILATLGTKGAEIGQIRVEMDKLRLENETLQAEIDKAKTTDMIEPEVAKLPVKPASVETVVSSPSDNTVVGLNRN